MASMTIRSTYALDPETVGSLARLATQWGVSRSEALRRAVRAAAAGLSPAPQPQRALDSLQSAMGLNARGAEAWVRRVRGERRAASPRGR